MQAHRLFSFSILTALLVATSLSASAPQKSWVGEYVLPIKPLKEIKFWSADGKKEVLQPISSEWPFKVRGEEEGRVRIHDGRREGWVAKKDFVIGKDSLSYFEGRIDDNAKDAFALYMLGAIALLQGETDDAVARLTQSIKFAPKEIDAYVKRGQAWRLKEESDKAIEDFDTAIRLDPKFGPAYRQRGMLWAAKVDKKNKESGDAKMNLANALKDFAEALRIDADDAETYFQRGMMYLRKSDNTAALKDLDQVVRLMPDNAASRMIRGVALKEMKKHDLALKDFDAAVKLSPKSTRALDARANLLHFMKQYERAIADYDAMIKIDPEDAMAFAHRGFSRFGKMDLAKALEDYDEALRLSPKQSWAGLNRPVILLLLRKRGVVDGCQDFLEVHGFKDRLSPYVGIIGYLGARQEKAEFSAKQFLEDSKKFGSAWPAPIFKLLQGDIDADALLAQAKENGEQTEARCYIGCNYLLKNQKKEAASHFQWVVENGDPGYVEYLIARFELDRLKSSRD